METSLTGKVVVIAGIGGDIGRSVAAAFAAERAQVIGIDYAGTTDAYPTVNADLREETAVRDVIAEIAATRGRIDVLYNNAGPLSSDDRALESNPLSTWTRVFADVLHPVINTCRYVVPVMRAEGGGVIINTSSFLAGMGAATAQTAFSAAKAAVLQLTRDLGTHLAATGIRVNALSLGPVETDLTRAMFARLGTEGAKARLTHIPTGRFARPDEIAAMAVFLASPGAGYITASAIPVHGGIQNAYTIPE